MSGNGLDHLIGEKRRQQLDPRALAVVTLILRLKFVDG
jgi:hypothetical protein